MSLTGRGQIERAAGSLSGGMQNMANLYGSQAGMYNQAAQQGWQGFGQGLGNLAYSLQGMNQPTQPLSYGAFQNAYSNANMALPAGSGGMLPTPTGPVPTPPY